MTAARGPNPPPRLPLPPVYAARKTLEQLSIAYGGQLWPELGIWAAEGGGKKAIKRKRVGADLSRTDEDHSQTDEGPGVLFNPYVFGH